MEEVKPFPIVCFNCHKVTTGWKGEDGRVRIQCPLCGAVTISKVISRRHIQVDVHAPKGQVLL